MKSKIKKALRIGGLFTGFLVFVAGGAVLLILIDKPLVKSAAEKYLAKKTGIEVAIGKLDYRFFPLRVTATGLKVRYDSSLFLLEAVIGRIEARGDLKKLLRGDKPSFEDASADIIELRIVKKRKSEEPTDFRALILGTSDILKNARKTALRCRRTEISYLGRDLGLEDAVLTCCRSAEEARFELLLDGERLSAAAGAGRFAFEAKPHFRASIAAAETALATFRLEFGNLRGKAAGKTLGLKSLNIDAEGTWETGHDKISLSKLALDIPALVSMTGSAVVDFSGVPRLEATIRGGIEDLESLVNLVRESLPPALKVGRVLGKVGFEGTYSLGPGAGGNNGTLALSLELKRVGFEYLASGVPLSGEITGSVRIFGAPPQLQASEDISVIAHLGRISRGQIDIRNSTLRFRVKGTTASGEISGFESASGGLSLAMSNKDTISFDVVKLRGGARVDFAGRSAVVQGLEVLVPGFPALKLDGRVNLKPPEAIEARVGWGSLKLPALRKLASPFIPTGFSDWNLDGSADIQVQAARGDPKSPWSFSSEITLSDFQFNDPTFTVASEKIRLLARMGGSYDPSRGVSVSGGSLDLQQGESLWKNVYIPWGTHPLKTDFSGSYNRQAGSIEGLSIEFASPDLGRVSLTGSFQLASPRSFRIRSGARLNLASLYSLSSGSAVSPGASPLLIDGDLAGDIELSSDSKKMSARGRLTVDRGSLKDPAGGLAASGISVSLPVNLTTSSVSNRAGVQGDVEKGTIQVQEIRSPLGTFRPPALNLSCGSNAYRVGPFSLDLLSSRLDVGELVLAIPPGISSFSAKTAIKLADVDLSRLPAGSDSLRLTGRARADFPEIVVTPEKITTAGEAEVDAFEGKIFVRNVAGSHPFSRGRTFSCDVELADLNLKELTGLTAFGEVTGIIRGEVRDLTISYGQPERFRLILESVKKKGVSQTFSLKAVDSLTVISAGEKPLRSGTPFWMRLIRGLRYDRIGIASTLDNDTFTIDGTIKEKGVEYLVKKPPLFGINVINRSPGKKIGFKDMMARLKSVGASDKPKITN